MSNSVLEQPLLPGTVETQDNPDSEMKKRCICSQIAPSPSGQVPSEPNRNVSVPDPKLFVGPLSPRFRELCLILVIYLCLGCVCFCLVKDQLKGEKTNRVLDALYFCIVTMTTVGYGDLVPDSVTTKLLACAFVFTGMAVVGFVISKAADYLVEKQELLLIKTLHAQRKGYEGKILKDVETNQAKYKFLVTSLSLVALMIIGTLFLLKFEHLSLIDSFYCVCSTITTLGYGDKSFSTKQGRAFAIIWILTSTTCLAQIFLYLAEMQTERRQQLLAQMVLKRKLTYTDLEAADLDYDGDVAAAEFVIYKLKEMGKISQDDVAVVLREFKNLDVDKSGTLNSSDISLAQSSK